MPHRVKTLLAHVAPLLSASQVSCCWTSQQTVVTVRLLHRPRSVPVSLTHVSECWRVQVLGTAAAAASVSLSPAKGALPSDTASPSLTVEYNRSASLAGDVAATAVATPLVLRVLVKVYFCLEEQQCLFEQVCFDVPFAGEGAASGGEAAVSLQHTVSALAPALAPL